MLTPRASLRRPAAGAVLLCLALIVLADWLFHDHPLGWSVGLFGAATLIVITAWNRAILERPAGRVAVAAVAGLTIACVEQPGSLAIGLGAIGLFVVAAIGRIGWTMHAGEWYRRFGWFAVRMWAQIPCDAAVWWRWRQRRPEAGGLLAAGRWSAAGVLGSVFLALFCIANPIIASRVGRTLEAGADFLSSFAAFAGWARVLLWLLVGVGMWALLRVGRRRGARTRREARPPTPVSSFPSTGLVIRCLVVFNVLFAVQTTLDLVYLWGGAALPDGLTYAEYARRGAYPLVASALLAAVFVLIAFRDTDADHRRRLARRLVCAWIAQNVLLVGAAAWRLALYVEAFSLTRWRAAAAVWMLLVAFGLVAIVWRIVRRRSGRWLIAVNTVCALLVLYVCAFIDFDGGIAEYNVRHCREVGGAGVPIDLEYLGRLGPEAIPALLRLAERTTGTPLAVEAAGRARAGRRALGERLEDWRAWTWRRRRLMSAR